MNASDRVRIHYRRLPDREQIFDQRIVLDRDDVIVTVTDPMALGEAMTVDGRMMLENGSRAVWFTFPGAWHDVGRFHRADGSFTGCYRPGSHPDGGVKCDRPAGIQRIWLGSCHVDERRDRRGPQRGRRCPG